MALLDPNHSLPDDPVPVIFRVASWNPNMKSLQEWMIEELVAEHRTLKRRTKGKGKIAAQLVGGGHILPILDGFDEIASSFRAEAIQAVNGWLNSNYQLVVTSRPDEYLEARDASGVITAAAVVMLEELTIAEVADYLPQSAPSGEPKEEGVDPGSKWDPVLDRMNPSDADPAGVMLREVFATPLNVSLARTIYSDTETDPGELLDRVKFPNVDDVSNHLLDHFARVRYAQPSGADAHKSYLMLHPEVAQRWLGYLAVRLQQLDTYDIAWWTLHTRRFSIAYRAIAFVLTLAISALIFAKKSSGVDLLAAGLVFILGLTGLLAGSLSGPKKIHRLPLASMEHSGHISGSHLYSRIARFATMRIIGRALTAIVLAGFNATLMCSIAVAVTHIFLATQEPLKPTTATVLSFAFFPSSAVVIIAASTLWESSTLRSASPRLLLKSDLIVVLVSAVAYEILLLGLIAVVAVLNNDTPNVWSMLLLVVATIITALMTSVSGIWLVNCCWHATSGRLPLFAMRFLEDAHRRGILRQAGDVYQFKHALLQERLAHNARIEQDPGSLA